MTTLTLSGNASGAGVFLLEAPSSANSRTITLPDANTTLVGTDATQTLTNKTLTSPTLTSPTMTSPVINSATFATVDGTAPLYGCRAWVNFNGTGTVAIRASGNVTDITDNGTGDYTVNFTTAMPDANYSIGGTTQAGTSGAGGYLNGVVPYLGSQTTTTSRIVSKDYNSAIDGNFVSVQFFR